jgi:hypothetical protein
MKFRHDKNDPRGITRRWRWRRPTDRQEPTHEAHVEPSKFMPWLPRGLADRVRRSPRN